MPARAGWTPFASMDNESSPGSVRRTGGLLIGAVGAKNLNLKRRTPLSPMNSNRQREQPGENQKGVLKQHTNTTLGGKVGVVKSGGSGWSSAMLQSEVPLLIPTNSAQRSPSPEDLAANRTRVKSEVTEIGILASTRKLVCVCTRAANIHAARH